MFRQRPPNVYPYLSLHFLEGFRVLLLQPLIVLIAALAEAEALTFVHQFENSFTGIVKDFDCFAE